MTPQVQPLSYKHRNLFFLLLAGIFVASLPFLFLYATGYRFSFGDNIFVSTGGLYIGVERTGAQIYIDDELVRETRIFRRAFYSQGLDATTHKVHVQKEGHHTWVKELPVYPHLVTEAQAFNLPLVPVVRIISKWQTTAGVPVVTSTSTILTNASTTNQYLFLPKAETKSLATSTEFAELLQNFVAVSTPQSPARLTAVSTTSTTTKSWRDVVLYENQNGVYATYVGNSDQMPYYYCAEEFPRYAPVTSTSSVQTTGAVQRATAIAVEKDDLPLEVQSVAKDAVCDPTIKIDGGGEIQYFDFFPNSTDLIITAGKNGAYVVEIDDRSWQNRQPLLLGDGLEFRVINGAVYAYDEEYIYQITINTSWF